MRIDGDEGNVSKRLTNNREAWYPYEACVADVKREVEEKECSSFFPVPLLPSTICLPSPFYRLLRRLPVYFELDKKEINYLPPFSVSSFV